MKSSVIAIVGVIVLVIIGYFVFMGSDDDTSESANLTNTPTQTENIDVENEPIQTEDDLTGSDGATTFTLAEVQTHASEDDCWTVIDGVVYDITQYVASHPGGDEILRACGADGSSLFNSRKTEDGETVGSGTPHSSRAQSSLSQFEIGTLAQ